MNRIVHYEIHAEDLARAKKFYQDAFGWKTQDMGAQYGDYVMLINGPTMDEMMGKPWTPEAVGINGGMMLRKGPRPAPDAPVNGYVCIVGVTNIDESIQKVEAAGGTLALAKMDVPNVGKLAYYHDTEGNIFGMLEPLPMPMTGTQSV